jgi:imidazolonepropionase-like amidohydrolase
MKCLIFNATVWVWEGHVMALTAADRLGNARTRAYVIVERGIVRYVSQSDEALPASEEFHTIINANGRLLLPGLVGTRVLLLTIN